MIAPAGGKGPRLGGFPVRAPGMVGRVDWRAVGRLVLLLLIAVLSWVVIVGAFWAAFLVDLALAPPA